VTVFACHSIAIFEVSLTKKRTNSLSVWPPEEFARFHNNPFMEECHADIRFARQLRQVFNQIEAISASRCRNCERDGDITGGFDLRRQTLFGARRQLHQNETAGMLRESTCDPAPDGL
jgi:hypothetical protein